ncbi:MAG: o-succinylbenzoate--CoA ligase [Pseudanabaenaceae cyanobacterium]
MSDLQICQGQKVGLYLSNQPLTLMLYFALLKLGAIVIWLNKRLTSHEVIQQMVSIGGELIIADQGLSNNQCRLIRLEQIKSLVDFTKTAEHPLEILTNSLQIFFTSGTTGKPKAVPLSGANFVYSAIAVVNFLRQRGVINQRWLLCLPLYHVGGMGIVWRSLLTGGTIHLLEKFDPIEIIEIVQTGQVNLISLVPTMLKRILTHELFAGTLPYWQNMGGIFLGGARADRVLLEQCLDLKLPVLVTYGMTEAASQISILDLQKYPHKIPSVGQVLPHMDLQIQDTEICIKSPALMTGYWGHSPINNYFPTGDLGYLDQDGFLYLYDRRIDLIISGGENIYPAELEAILSTHPQIGEVCVVAQPDPEWGQVPALFYTGAGDLTLEAVQNYCLAHHLARYKLPKALYHIPRLPLTASGKCDRQYLRKVVLGIENQDIVSTNHSDPL